MRIFVLRHGEKPKALKAEAVEKRVPGPHRKIVKTILGITVPIGKVGEVHGFMSEGSSSIRFAARIKEPESGDPEQIKWGEPIGHVEYAFDDLEREYELHESTQSQRDAFKNDVRKAIIGPLRQQLSDAEATVRRLRPFFPPKQDGTKEAEAGEPIRLPRPLGAAKTNGAGHHGENQTAAA